MSNNSSFLATTTSLLFLFQSQDAGRDKSSLILERGELLRRKSIHLTKWTDSGNFFLFSFFHFSFSALWERERKFLHLKEHIAESFITTDVLCATRIMLWHGEWKEEKFRGLFSLPERKRDDWFGSESFERELLTATPSVCKQVNFSTAVICMPVIYFLRRYYAAEC